ncbi:MAG: hypothetical protein AAF791_11700 [Bacteroidota bacterium]
MNTLRAKWRPIVGLVIVIVATVYSLNWVWGILFLMWVAPDLLTGVTYFLEEVRRDREPILYWAIMGAWVLLSLFLFIPQSWYTS